MIRLLALLTLSLIACGDGGDPCQSGTKLADIPMPTSTNPSARSIICLPADKALPEGARWL